ncbi:MAG: hypothetical protein LM583_10640 [Desulfurococcaceae archaeon]|nr:hypothetical protein [Desulfurococcaceae archaeon]
MLVSGFNYSKFVVLLSLWCLLLMAMLFTVVQLLLEVMAMHKVIAGIHVASATSMEMLVKSFAEGSIHTELATMLRNSITRY